MGSEVNSSQVRSRIAFLHGMGGTGQLWRPIAADLERDFDLISLDQRGHGQSLVSETLLTPDPIRSSDPYLSKNSHADATLASAVTGSSSSNFAPVEFAPTEFAKDVLETLNAEHLLPSFVVGHSMGVRTAAALALIAAPGSIQGLVLVDLGMGTGIDGGGLGAKLSNFLSVLPDRFESRKEAITYLTTHAPDTSIGLYLAAVLVADGTGVRFPFQRQALIQTIQASRGLSIRNWVMQAIEKNIPVLVLRGANSNVYTRDEFENEKAFFAHHADRIRFFEFENAGHGLPFERRAEFVKVLREFISKGNFIE